MSEWKEVQFRLKDDSLNGTLQDYGFYLESWSIGDPEPITNYIEIPGSTEPLDVSNAITDYTTYRNRILTFVLGTVGTLEDRLTRESQLVNDLNGLKSDIYLSWYPWDVMYPDVSSDDGGALDWHFRGRIKISSKEHIEPEYTKITLECDCNPFAITELHRIKTIETAADAQEGFTIDFSNELYSVVPTMIVDATQDRFQFVVTVFKDSDWVRTEEFYRETGEYRDPKFTFMPGYEYVFDFASADPITLGSLDLVYETGRL